VDEAMATHVIGDPATVRDGLAELHHRTAADELIISTRAHSYETRLRSLELVAASAGSVNPAAPAKAS
jgi:alkanesulfonate monooxygenase SsuD/methylene tetrahydromethanopterin reductase-like flavin-dependent oxidoreductase (luciferase family)